MDETGAGFKKGWSPTHRRDGSFVPKAGVEDSASTEGLVPVKKTRGPGLVLQHAQPSPFPPLEKEKKVQPKDPSQTQVSLWPS